MSASTLAEIPWVTPATWPSNAAIALVVEFIVAWLAVAIALSIVVLRAEDSLKPVIDPSVIVYCASKVSTLIPAALLASLKDAIWLVTLVIAVALISASPVIAVSISTSNCVPKLLTERTTASLAVVNADIELSTPAIAFVLKRFWSVSKSVKSLAKDALKFVTDCALSATSSNNLLFVTNWLPLTNMLALAMLIEFAPKYIVLLLK